MDINNSSEDINQIIFNILTDEEGNIPFYSSGEPIYESAYEIEKTTEKTPEQLLDKHLNSVFKPPILNQETQLGKKKQRKKSGRKTKDDKSTGKKHDKNYKDNMRIRLKIQFYNFIINFVNYVIKFRYDISNLIFRHLTHEEKQNTNLEYNKDIFQNKTIGFILQLDVSTKYNNKSDQNRINYLKILERIKKKENNDKFLELVDMNVATFYNSIYLTKNIPSILDYYCPNRKTKEKIPMFFTMFIDTLKNKIIELFNLEKLATNDPTYLSSARSISLLKRSLNILEESINKINDYPIDIIELDLKEAWSLLGEINGKTYKDELIDEMFSRFCLGK